VKYRTFLPVLIFALTPAISAQSAQVPPGSEMRAEHHQNMMDMRGQEVQAMKADIVKMKASLAAMRANLSTINNMNELDRWRDNVDLWQTMVDHMEQMEKHMESMGPVMMQGHGMGGPPPSAPSGRKPE
jgi:hypothetical protein